MLLDNLNARLQKTEEAPNEDSIQDREFMTKIIPLDFKQKFENFIKVTLNNAEYPINQDRLNDELSLRVLTLED